MLKSFPNISIVLKTNLHFWKQADTFNFGDPTQVSFHT